MLRIARSRTLFLSVKALHTAALLKLYQGLSPAPTRYLHPGLSGGAQRAFTARPCQPCGE